MFSKPFTITIDKHLIARYDKNPDEFLIKSRSKSSTTYFESYCIEKQCRDCIGMPCHTKESNSTFVHKLLNNTIKNNIMMPPCVT